MVETEFLKTLAIDADIEEDETVGDDFGGSQNDGEDEDEDEDEDEEDEDAE